MSKPKLYTDLQMFAEITLKNGGEWWLLEESENYSLYSCKTKYTANFHVYYNPPTYQVFNKAGKRVFTSSDYMPAFKKYKRLCEGDTE